MLGSQPVTAVRQQEAQGGMTKWLLPHRFVFTRDGQGRPGLHHRSVPLSSTDHGGSEEVVTARTLIGLCAAFSQPDRCSQIIQGLCGAGGVVVEHPPGHKHLGLTCGHQRGVSRETAAQRVERDRSAV